MARMYANENFPRPVVDELRRLGHDVLTIQETGKAGIQTPDDEVLDFAKSETRAVLTLNRKHFLKLHRESAAHSGIILCTVDSDFIGQAQRIHTQIEALPQLDGQVIRVNRPS